MAINAKALSLSQFPLRTSPTPLLLESSEHALSTEVDVLQRQGEDKLIIVSMVLIVVSFPLAREQQIIQLTQKLITSITTGDFETYWYLYIFGIACHSNSKLRTVRDF